MDTGPVLVESVGNAVPDDGGHGPEVGHARPQAVPHGQVGALQLTRLARVEALGPGIRQVPKVYIAHLGHITGLYYQICKR